MTLLGSHFLFQIKMCTFRKNKAQIAVVLVTVSGLTNTTKVWSLLMWDKLEYFSILTKNYMAT